MTIKQKQNLIRGGVVITSITIVLPTVMYMTGYLCQTLIDKHSIRKSERKKRKELLTTEAEIRGLTLKQSKKLFKKN